MQEPQEDRKEWMVAAMVAAVAIPLVWVWLGLGAIIIYKATTDAAFRADIEGSLVALAVLTIPATAIVQGAFRKWLGGD